MNRFIKAMEESYLLPALELVQTVFTEYDSPEEGRMVRRLVEEIRSKKYYIPELELIMKLLILTPVAVKIKYQRQDISKELLEYGFEKAKAMGFQAVLVEGDPKNYNFRGFVTQRC